MQINSLAEIEQGKVDFPVLGHLVEMGFKIRWQHLIFKFILYTLLYIEPKKKNQ